MNKITWQLQQPISAIVFDCDGTLSNIEGIDELANTNGVGTQVKALTANAMGQSGINPTLYQQRLDLVKPNREQIISLANEYYAQRTPDIAEVIKTFERLNKSVYIVSAGVNPAVTQFGKLLNISAENIFAVNLSFNAHGQYLDFDRSSPLASNTGKRNIVTQLKTKHKNIAYVGDGLNDVTVMDLVTRFVGYGGAYLRENIAAMCEFYIRTKSLAPLLPLTLTEQESAHLLPAEKIIYQKGMGQLPAQ